jgi:hypothetical protein
MNSMKMTNSQTKAFAAAFFLFLLAACAAKPETDHVPAAAKTAAAEAVRVSAPEADVAEPALAADSDKNVYVVYVEHNADKSADVYLQKFDAAGNPSGEKTRINPEKGQVKAWYGDAPTIKTGRDGRVFVGWTAKTPNAEKPGASVLNLSVSSDGGKTFGAPVKVNDDLAPASHGMHSLAVGEDGRIFMAWLDERNLKAEKAETAEKTDFGRSGEIRLPGGFSVVKIHHNSNRSEKPSAEKKDEMKHEESEPNSEVFFAASSDGGQTFSPNKKLAGDVCPCCKTSVVAAPDGKVYVGWRQVLENKFRHIAVAASIDGGANFEKPSIVSDDRWELNACPVSGASMIFDGALKIVWYTAGAAGKPGLYYAESKDGGRTFDPRALLSAETVTGTSTILSEPGQRSRVVFSEANGRVVVGSAENAADKFSVGPTIDGAQLPGAALVGEKLFVAFVREEKNKRSVWLSRLDEK